MPVPDVPLDESVPRIVLQPRQGLAMAGVAEHVEIDDLHPAGPHQMMHKVAADKTGAARYKESAHAGSERNVVVESSITAGRFVTP